MKHTNKYAGLMDEIEAVLGERKRMLTVNEFALLSGKHRQTVWQWCARGELPATQARKYAPYLIHFHQLIDHFEECAA